MIIRVMLLFFLALPGARAGEGAVYRFSRAVIAADNAQQTLLALPLDAEVYAGANADLGDLRLIDAAGLETPYWLQKIAGRKTVLQRIPSRAAKTDLRKNGPDGIVVSLALSQDALDIDGFNLVTSQRDFEYSLRVQGSADGKNWHPLVDKALIFDYSRFMPIANTEVALPANRDRFFQIAIDSAVESQAAELLELSRTLQGETELRRDEKIAIRRQPLHIERIEPWANRSETVSDAEQQFDYALNGFTVSQDAERKITLIDIASRNQPLTGFKLDIANPNFNRRAEVQVPLKQGIETRMQTLAQGTVSALHFKEINRDETHIGFAEQRRQNYRIVLYNDDNPPLRIANVTGTGPGYQLVFLAQPGQTYRLRYGANQASMPRYEVLPMQTLLSEGYQPVVAALGPEIAADLPPGGFDPIVLLNSPLFLGLVIGLTVLVLGWSLYKVAKRL
ncbi:DUF3999 domain-containing protein [Methylomonas sp. SURF-2]|uniref:DUF3999 domain-containing protein n=1 Tax=Methylomonas subterranea TaxID=2952225 RepID=A0ABT1TKG3_9GAMM|nr:DUF3999 family protein [Methylomonas sp. SURF-2]MCQ8105706.1 DUF3999 domain-containing protein [Methylomonas sp. SURF-2]